MDTERQGFGQRIEPDIAVNNAERISFTDRDCQLSIAISLKRIAGAVCGDDKNSGIIHALFDLIARPS